MKKQGIGTKPETRQRMCLGRLEAGCLMRIFLGPERKNILGRGETAGVREKVYGGWMTAGEQNIELAK